MWIYRIEGADGFWRKCDFSYGVLAFDPEIRRVSKFISVNDIDTLYEEFQESLNRAIRENFVRAERLFEMESRRIKN